MTSPVSIALRGTGANQAALLLCSPKSNALSLAIARGVVDAFFEGGASLSLAGDLDVGDEVSVRLGFGRGAPTLPAAGLVVSVRDRGEHRQYSLRWTCDGSERTAIEHQIALLGTVH